MARDFKYRFAHLGDTSPHTGGNRTLQYAKRFPWAYFYSIGNECCEGKSPGSAGDTANYQIMNGDFMEKLGEIPDSSLTGVYSDMTLGYYSSNEYLMGLLAAIKRKLLPGGKLSFSIDSEMLSGNDGRMGKMLADGGFGDFSTRELAGIEHDRTNWTTYYHGCGKKLLQVSVKKPESAL